MRTFHVSTFCDTDGIVLDPDQVMPLIEIVFVINLKSPPSEHIIQEIIERIVPEVKPVLSEVNEVPYVGSFKRQ